MTKVSSNNKIFLFYDSNFYTLHNSFAKSLSKKFKKRLLVSEHMKVVLEKQHLFKFSGIGEVNLRGKARKVYLYGVEPA